METPPAIIQELGTQLGLPNLALDEFSACHLTFDGSLVCLEANEEEDRLLIYAPVCDLPDEGRGAVYERLLAENLFKGASGDLIFAASSEAGKVVLQTVLPIASLEVSDLVAKLEEFLAAMDRWRAATGAPAGAEPAPFHSLDPARFV